MAKTIMLVFINAINTGLNDSAKVTLVILISIYQIIGEVIIEANKSEATAPVIPHIEERG